MLGSRTQTESGFWLTYDAAPVISAYVPADGTHVSVVWNGAPSLRDLTLLCEKAASQLPGWHGPIYRLAAGGEDGARLADPSVAEPEDADGFIRLQVGADMEKPDLVVWGDLGEQARDIPNVGVAVEVAMLDSVREAIVGAIVGGRRFHAVQTLPDALADRLRGELARIPADVAEARYGLPEGDLA